MVDGHRRALPLAGPADLAALVGEEARAGDREVLEEMVRGAVNQAIAKVRVLAHQSYRALRVLRWANTA